MKQKKFDIIAVIDRLDEDNRELLSHWYRTFINSPYLPTTVKDAVAYMKGKSSWPEPVKEIVSSLVMNHVYETKWQKQKWEREMYRKLKRKYGKKK